MRIAEGKNKMSKSSLKRSEPSIEKSSEDELGEVHLDHLPLPDGHFVDAHELAERAQRDATLAFKRVSRELR